jgi:hypothetical protein
MNKPNDKQTKNSQPSNPENSGDDKLIDPRELNYQGGYSGDPREIVENPAVAPDMVEPAPEDLRDDLMPKQKSEEE